MPIAASNIAMAASLFASLADLTFERPLMPKASNKTASRSIANLMGAIKVIRDNPIYEFFYD